MESLINAHFILVDDLLQNSLVCTPDQHMKVLQRPNTLQDGRVLPPQHILLAKSLLERPFHVVFQLLPHFKGQEPSSWILLKDELGPDHQMSDARFEAVGIFIVQDLQVPRILERASNGVKRLPAKLILDDVRLNGADCLLDLVYVKAIFAKRAGKASEMADALVVDVVLCFGPGDWLVFGVPHGDVDDVLV